jgi:hypothetical protein
MRRSSTHNAIVSHRDETLVLSHENGTTMTASSDESPRKLTERAAYLILFCSLPIHIVFAIFGKIGMGFGAWICSGLVILVARTLTLGFEDACLVLDYDRFRRTASDTHRAFGPLE